MVVAAREGVARELHVHARRERALHVHVEGLRAHVRHHRAGGVPDHAGRRDLVDGHSRERVHRDALVDVVLVDRLPRGVRHVLDGERALVARRRRVVEPAPRGLGGAETHGIGSQDGHAPGIGQEDLRDHLGIVVAGNLARLDPAHGFLDSRLRQIQRFRAPLIGARDLGVHDRGRDQSCRDDDQRDEHEERDHQGGSPLVRAWNDEPPHTSSYRMKTTSAPVLAPVFTPAARSMR